MRRLSLSLIIVIVASTISLGWLLNKIYLYSQPNSHDQLHARYNVLGREIVNVLGNASDREAFIKQWNQSSDYYLYIIDKDNFPVPQELVNEFNNGRGLTLESSSGLGLYYKLPHDGHVLSISLPQHPSQANNLELILTISFYIGVIIIILLWVWPLLKELARLRDASSRFGKGDLSARVEIKGLSYIADIEQEFNHMADHIQSLIADNKLLSRAVSHDLKTPLARLRFGLEALSETDDAPQKQRYADRINADLEEMEMLIDTLLQYARLDEGRLSLKLEKVNLAELCHDLLEAFEYSDQPRPEFKAANMDISVSADRRYLSMLINNLVVNATHYAAQSVALTLTQSDNQIILCVEDDGPGIAPEERANVLKPFWRGNNQRSNQQAIAQKTNQSATLSTPGTTPSALSSPAQTKKKGNHGMGLAIASRIAEWHRASLQISDSATLGGAKVCIIFSI